MKKYLVPIGLSLLLATVFLLGCATKESELQEVNARVSELELRILSLEGELLVQTATNARLDAELALIRATDAGQDAKIETLWDDFTKE